MNPELLPYLHLKSSPSVTWLYLVPAVHAWLQITWVADLHYVNADPDPFKRMVAKVQRSLILKGMLKEIADNMFKFAVLDL